MDAVKSWKRSRQGLLGVWGAERIDSVGWIRAIEAAASDHVATVRWHFTDLC